MNKKELAMPELKQSYKFLSLELHINKGVSQSLCKPSN